MSPERVALAVAALALALGLVGGAAPGAGLWQAAAQLRTRADGAAVALKAMVDDLETVLVKAGALGPLVVFCVYLVTTVFMLPLWGFHMVCGYVYGTLWASLLIATTQAVCASAAFTFSRYVVGPHIRGWLVRRYGRKFEAIDHAVSQDGFRIVLLLRLSPIIPFGINNYICGMSRIKLADFALGTFLGVLPGTTAYCNLGAMSKTIQDSGMTPLQRLVTALGVIAALAVVKLISDLSTKALKAAGIDDDAPGKSQIKAG
jgi:uncharacterized membrane protein YdjX (TVP38/TMEM64 family)